MAVKKTAKGADLKRWFKEKWTDEKGNVKNNNMAATKKFKAHMMYNPKTGKGSMANKMADHLRMKKLGYGHTKPKKKK